MAIGTSSLLNIVTNVFRVQTAKVMEAAIVVGNSHEKWGWGSSASVVGR
jgi:hypothetical protein